MAHTNGSKCRNDLKVWISVLFAVVAIGMMSAAAYATPQRGPSGGGAAPAACPDVHRTIVGEWHSGALTETYAADGAYTLHNTNGTFRGRYTWTGPNTATVVVAEMNAVYKFAMTDSNELVAINGEDVGTVYTRTPVEGDVPMPATCITVRRQIVGSWVGGNNYHESYTADGTYTFNGTRGTYRFISPGRADLTLGDTTGSYRFAMMGPNEVVAISVQTNRAMTYHREH